MVISAHYDHLGVRDGAMYPGADDNASGVCRRCWRWPDTASRRRGRTTPCSPSSTPKSAGCRARSAFVAAPPIPKARIALNVNLDMVSRSAKHELYVAGTAQHPELKPPLEAVAAARAGHAALRPRQADGAAGPMYDWTMQSDHGAFHAQGIPFVYFGVEDHEDYHKPTDTRRQDRAGVLPLGRRDHPRFDRRARSLAAVAAPVSKRPARRGPGELETRLETLYEQFNEPLSVTDPIQIVRRFDAAGGSSRWSRSAPPASPSDECRACSTRSRGCCR